MRKHLLKAFKDYNNERKNIDDETKNENESASPSSDEVLSNGISEAQLA